MPVLGGRVLSALLMAALAAPAAAQQKACELDEGSPNQVARAKLDIQLAQSSSKPADAANKLKDAVKLLNDGDLKKNPSGRAYVLGQTFVYWLAQPGMSSGMTTRGTVGFVTDTAGKYDIIAGIDSSFTVVETLNPECASTTGSWRQQKPWVDLINHALELSGQGSDSAVYLAKRSLQLSHTAPYAYMVLAQAAAKANNPKEAIVNYKEAIATAEKDTSQAMMDNRRGWLYALGGYAADLSETAEAADKANYMSEAKAAYAALAKDPGTKYADAARSGQARLASISGDTAAIKGSYADQLANPGAFSYNSLMLAAVTAARTSQNKDAVKLFEAAKGVNPYHRDVLYNLSRLYMLDSAYAKGIAIARQLVAIDPWSPDNFQLLALGYAGIQKGYGVQTKAFEAKAKAYGDRANAPRTAAAVVKANIDSAARMTPLIKAYGDSAKVAVDSAIKYNDMMTKVPARVTFTEFTPGETKTTLGGSLANLGDAPRSYTLKMEFVDKSGNVVASQDLTFPDVPAHASKPIVASATVPGVVAFRYTGTATP